MHPGFRFARPFARAIQFACAVLALCLVSVTVQAVETKADYAIMIDGETGQVLFEKNADALMSPSSMSKLMTVEMVFHAMSTGALSFTDTFHVSEKAWKMEGLQDVDPREHRHHRGQSPARGHRPIRQ